MADPDIYWDGESGSKYGYWIYPIGSRFKDESGNFIYARETDPRYWRPVYIGQASNLQNRLADQDVEAIAKRHGATHVHVHTTSGGEKRRLAEETDLMRRWRGWISTRHD
jgi:hypothetical protein